MWKIFGAISKNCKITKTVKIQLLNVLVYIFTESVQILPGVKILTGSVPSKCWPVKKYGPRHVGTRACAEYNTKNPLPCWFSSHGNPFLFFFVTLSFLRSRNGTQTFGTQTFPTSIVHKKHKKHQKLKMFTKWGAMARKST